MGPATRLSENMGSVPASYAEYLDRTVRSPKLLVAVPRDAVEFEQVYGGPPSAVQMRQLEQFTSRLTTTESSTRLSGGLDQLQSVISSSDSDPVVLLVHSEDGGRTLVLPDGGRVSAVEVHRFCSAEGRPCILLTCHSSDLAIDGEINLLDALDTYRDGQRLADERVDLSVEDLVTEMIRSFGRRSLRKQITISFAATAGGAISYVLYDGDR